MKKKHEYLICYIANKNGSISVNDCYAITTGIINKNRIEELREMKKHELNAEIAFTNIIYLGEYKND